MKVALYSNYLNHHQLPFCQAMHRLTGGQFVFVATEEISRERLSVGYADMDHAYPFVLCAYDGQQQKEAALRLAKEADLVIHGSAPREYLEARLQLGKLTFMYSERLYKQGFEWWKWPIRLVRHYWWYGRYKSLYLLCASAFTAGDFAKTLTFRGKAYRWGYFPETKTYDDIDALMDKKKQNRILWAARFLELKHPEYVVEVARRLKAHGYSFEIEMLGNGERLDAIRQQINEHGLEEYVHLLGAVPADEVRGYMEEASIYLFTSDRNEGWGAVLNESMNSGCAVVACSAIGSVPFLLQDGENGLTYASGNVDELYQKVKYLLDYPQECKGMGQKAYFTMTEAWNAETAAERLTSMAQWYLHEGKLPDLYESGPGSKANKLQKQ